jgi:hypothetical protein
MAKKKTKPTVKKRGTVRAQNGRLTAFEYCKHDNKYFILVYPLKEEETTTETTKNERIIKKVQTERLKRSKGETDAKYNERLKTMRGIKEGEDLPKGFETEIIVTETEVIEAVPVITTVSNLTRGKAERLEMYVPLNAHQVTKAVKNYINS